MVNVILDKRQCLHEAINFLELMYLGEDRDDADAPARTISIDSPWLVAQELEELGRILQKESALAAQASLMWQLGVDKQQPVAWFCREHSPLTCILFAVCVSQHIAIERAIGGRLSDEDFALLIAAFGKLAAASVKWFDVRANGAFLHAACVLVTQDWPRQNPGFFPKFVLCDWRLGKEEAATAYKLTADSAISFICP